MNKRLFIGLALFVPFSSMACTTCGEDNSKPWSVPIQGGFFAVSSNNTQDIQIEGLIGNRMFNNNFQMSALVGIGLYYNSPPQEDFQISYGINPFYLGQMTVKGNITQEQVFTNLSYQYQIQYIPIYFATHALIFTDNPAFSVTLDAGVGPNAVWISGYKETPLNNFTVPDNAFKCSTSIDFSATAGIGFRINNNQGQMPVECGYRFFYLGQGSLAKNNSQLINTLNTGNLYANALVCSVTL